MSLIHVALIVVGIVFLWAVYRVGYQTGGYDEEQKSAQCLRDAESLFGEQLRSVYDRFQKSESEAAVYGFKYGYLHAKGWRERGENGRIVGLGDEEKEAIQEAKAMLAAKGTPSHKGIMAGS